MDRGSVAQIMKARLEAGSTFAMQTRVFPDLFERPFELVDRNGFPVAVKEKRVIRIG
jgi:hypothetical protein